MPLDSLSPIRFTPTQTLNEIVAQAPETLPVLQQFGLDTCCGGALPLSEAAGHHGLEVERLLTVLNEVVEPA